MHPQQHISRRSLILTAGAVLAVSMPQSAGASSELNELIITPLPKQAMETVLAAGGEPLLYAGDTLGFEANGLIPSETEIRIDFDERMYRIYDDHIIQMNLKSLGHENTDVIRKERSIILKYCKDTQTRGAHIFFGHVRVNRYPYDLVGNPLPAEAQSRRPATTSSKRGSNSRAMLNQVFKDTPISSWGAELGVMWSSLPGRPEQLDEYRIPLAISVRSTGPGPIPSGSYLEVRAEPTIVGAISLTHSSGQKPFISETSEYFSSASVLGVRWRIKHEIPAGKSAMMQAHCGLRKYTQATADPKLTTIDFIANHEYSALQRTTGRESIRYEEYRGPFIYIPLG